MLLFDVIRVAVHKKIVNCWKCLQNCKRPVLKLIFSKTEYSRGRLPGVTGGWLLQATSPFLPFGQVFLRRPFGVPVAKLKKLENIFSGAILNKKHTKKQNKIED